MLGDANAILGSAPQNAEVIQREEAVKQSQAQGRADVAMGPGEAAGKEAAVGQVRKKLNEVTISPQMADGLEKMTGQKWDRAVGTKWDANVFTALATGLTQAKYHQDVLSGRVSVEEMKEKASQERQDQREQDKKELEDVKSKHTKELEDLKATHRKEIESMKMTAKKEKSSPDPETQGRQLLDAINKATKSGDDSNKNAAIKNYNDFAKEHNLAPYSQDEGFFSSALSAIKGMFGKGGGGAKDAVGDYLKKNGIKDTSANRKWAESKVNANQ